MRARVTSITSWASLKSRCMDDLLSRYKASVACQPDKRRRGGWDSPEFSALLRREQVRAGHALGNRQSHQREQRRRDVAEFSALGEPAAQSVSNQQEWDEIRRVRGERISSGVEFLFGVSMVGGDRKERIGLQCRIAEPSQALVDDFDRLD